MKKVLFRILLITLLLLCGNQNMHGQVKKNSTRDSCVMADDTCKKKKLTLPEQLERFALKDNIISKLLRSIMVFDNKKTSPKDTTKVSEKNYRIYENKIIRKIDITVLGPFGYSVTQTFVHPISKLQRAGDNIHYLTRHWVVYEKLLFEEGDYVDAVKISESERLIRQSPYIVDAKITVKPLPGNKDSADILVVVQDVFNLSAGASGDPQKPNGNLSVTDINFLGLGQRFYNEIWYDRQYAQGYKYSGSYSVSQIANTYISGELHYTNVNYDRKLGFNFSRPFFSSTSKWAGGLDVEFIHEAYSITTLPDSNKYAGLHNYNTQDFWLGYAFTLNENPLYRFKKSQLIVSGRVFNITYLDQDKYPDDFNHAFQNDRLYLAGVGFSHRDYYKDHYIFAFGRTEDIPLGYLFTLNTGPDLTQYYNRLYTGAKASYGWNNSALGYMYLSIETGGFLNKNIIEQGVLNTELFYFTNLLSLGKWQFRQYLMNRYTLGYNRKPGEYLNINGQNGLQRFSSYALNGTQRWANNYEADFFSPWSPLGFKIVFVFYMDDALLGTHTNTILRSRVYQGYGLAIRFKNEHFIFNTLELAFRYFPGGAEAGGRTFQYTSTGSTSLHFQDFQFSEPYTAGFN